MRSPNLTLSKKTHANISIRSLNESPFFILPSIYFISKHDVNIEIEGYSLGFIWARWCFQINLRKQAWTKSSSNIDLSKANILSQKMSELYSGPPLDPTSIVKAFDKNKWLKELINRNVDQSYYALLIIKEVSKEEQYKKDPIKNVDLNFNTQEPINIEGLE